VPDGAISDDAWAPAHEQAQLPSVGCPAFETRPSLLFAPGRNGLSRPQPIHAATTAGQDENTFPISPTSAIKRGANDRANTRDFLQPPAFFNIEAIGSMDAALSMGYGSTAPDSRIIGASKGGRPRLKNRGGGWTAINLLISDDLEQLCRAIAGPSPR